MDWRPFDFEERVMPAGVPTTWPTTTDSAIHLADGFLLFRVLDVLSNVNSDTTENAFVALVAYLAQDAARIDGQHTGVGGISELLEQLQRTTGKVPQVLAASLQQLPEMQRLYRRLAELQGSPQWLFQVRSDGTLRLVQLGQAMNYPPASLKWDTTASTGAATSAVFALEATAGVSLLWDVVPFGGGGEDEPAVVSAANNMVGAHLVATGQLEGAVETSPQLIPGVSGSMGGYARGSLRLSYQFFADRSVLSALDVVRSETPQPTRIKDVAAALVTSGSEGLQQIDFRLTQGGQLEASVELAMQKGGGGATSGKIALERGLSATINIGGSSQLERDVVVCKTSGGSLRLRRTVTRKRGRDVAAGVSLGVSLKGVDAWAAGLVDRILPDMGEFEKVIEEYATPGDMLTSALQKRLRNDDLLALAKLVLGLSDNPTVSQELTERLLAPIREAFDSVENLFDAASQAPQEIVERIVRVWLGQESATPRSRAAAELLTGPVGQAWADILKGLTERLDAIWTTKIKEKTEAQIRKVMEPLTAVLDLRGPLRSLEHLVGAIHGVLKRYGEYRAAALSLLKESIGQRLGFSLAYARNDEAITWLTRSYDIGGRGQLTSVQWKAAQKGFDRLLAGAEMTADSFGTAPVTSTTHELGGRASTTRTLSATLDLLPFTAVYSAKRNAVNEVLASPTGEIRVAHASFDNQERASSRSRAWSVRFSGSMNLVDARLGSALSSLPMGVEAEVSLAKADPEEVAGTLARLRLADTLSGNALFGEERLSDVRRAIHAATGGKPAAVRLAFGVLFPQHLFEEFVAKVGSLIHDERWATALFDSRRALLGSGGQLDAAVALASELLERATGARASLLDVFAAFTRPTTPAHELSFDFLRTPEMRVGALREPLRRYSPVFVGAGQLQKMLLAHRGLHRFAEKVRMLPNEVRLLGEAIARAPNDKERAEVLEAGLIRMLDLQSEANASLGWTLDGSDAAFASESLAPDTAALFATIARAFGQSEMQRPADNLRVWVAPSSRTLSGIAWKEVKL